MGRRNAKSGFSPQRSSGGLGRRIEDADGDIFADSGHGLGWEVGTGVLVPFGDTWQFTPGLRSRSLARALTVEGTSTNVDLTYVSLELGFARHF